ncbi:NAD(P)/FAD-dependent oxidoreductase [Nioella sp.]|jgi:glycine/D-amino acid oxidase-like deaminating enzyme|uniref:NAD(P)/FAD-dependent oxidoreductase n=1 Tax=Nioella sp. TaxID=1912091 RepID=UPI003A86CFA3
MRKADVIVIGGGITGLLTAWNLAEAGVDVVLLEAGDLGAQASGANAGSLHLQIQYPEFVKYGESWARAYGPCLGFLKNSLALWQDLSARTGEDLGVKLGGGIVVAQTEAQMALIRAKVRVEAAHGVETEILDREGLRAVAPYLSDKAIGGGFCAMEGKANTLRVIPAVQAAVERLGFTLLRHTPVTGIAAERGGYSVTTPRGAFQAGRVVNAAGAQAGKIAAMLGLVIEIDGFPLQVTVTEPVAPMIPHLIYSAAGKLSLKQALNGGCIIGGGWSAAKRPDGTLATDPVSLSGNMAIAADVVPRLGQIRALRSWTAWVNGTPDWRPIIGEVPDAPGFFLALFPWVGFSAAPMTAQVTAELVLGSRNTASLSGISVLAD